MATVSLRDPQVVEQLAILFAREKSVVLDKGLDVMPVATERCDDVIEGLALRCRGIEGRERYRDTQRLVTHCGHAPVCGSVLPRHVPN